MITRKIREIWVGIPVGDLLDGEIVCGTVLSVVLDRVGVSPRKFGLARGRGVKTVLGKNGVHWVIRKVDLEGLNRGNSDNLRYAGKYG